MRGLRRRRLHMDRGTEELGDNVCAGLIVGVVWISWVTPTSCIMSRRYDFFASADGCKSVDAMII